MSTACSCSLHYNYSSTTSPVAQPCYKNRETKWLCCLNMATVGNLGNTPHSFASSLGHWMSLPHLYLACNFPSTDSTKDCVISHSVVLQCCIYLQVSWYPNMLIAQHAVQGWRHKLRLAMIVLRQHDMSSFVSVLGHLLLVHTKYPMLQACLRKYPRSTLSTLKAATVSWRHWPLFLACSGQQLTVGAVHWYSCWGMLVSLTSNIQGCTLSCTRGKFCGWAWRLLLLLLSR